MHIEVDQSGKIEDTATDTVLAFSNAEDFAILIPAEVKRACIQELRRRGRRGKSLYRRVFVVGLFLLLKDHIQMCSLVTIDVEYTGQNAMIKGQLLNLLRGAGISVETERIRFDLIHRRRKRPPVHDKAYNTHRGKQKPDRVIALRDLLREGV